jgi:hypothetical protein
MLSERRASADRRSEAPDRTAPFLTLSVALDGGLIEQHAVPSTPRASVRWTIRAPQ